MKSVKKFIESLEVVVVTGGSSGIGEAFIEEIYALKKSILFFNLSRRQPSITLPDLNLHSIDCDLAAPLAIEEAASQIKAVVKHTKNTGPLLLINNAGFASYGSFYDVKLSEQLEMVNVNIRACVHLTGLLLPLIKEQGGVIGNVASLTSFQATPYMATYAASKAFLLNWSLALDAELKPLGIRSFALCPGPTKTAFFQRASCAINPASSWMQDNSATGVVRQLLKGMAYQKQITVPGWQNRLAACLVALLPKTLASKIAGWSLKQFRP